MSKDEEVYEVEAIKDRRKRNGKMEYQVEWRGYPSSKDYTWEGLNNLNSCKKMVEDFERSLKTPNKAASTISTSSSVKSERGTTPKRRAGTVVSRCSSSSTPAKENPRSEMKINPIATVAPITYDPADENVYDDASYGAYMKEHNLIDPPTTGDELPYFFGRALKGIKAYLFAEEAFLVLVDGAKSAASEDKSLFKIHRKLMNKKYPNALTSAIYGIVHDLD